MRNDFFWSLVETFINLGKGDPKIKKVGSQILAQLYDFEVRRGSCKRSGLPVNVIVSKSGEKLFFDVKVA